MRDGILYDDFARRFGVSVESEFGKVVERLMAQGLLEQTERGCRLTSWDWPMEIMYSASLSADPGEAADMEGSVPIW